MFDKNKIHLVPPIVIDRAEALETVKSAEALELYAQALETIRDYCVDALEKYAKRKSQKPTWKKTA